MWGQDRVLTCVNRLIAMEGLRYIVGELAGEPIYLEENPERFRSRRCIWESVRGSGLELARGQAWLYLWIRFRDE